jgi:hypothetical protein
MKEVSITYRPNSITVRMRQENLLERGVRRAGEEASALGHAIFDKYLPPLEDVQPRLRPGQPDRGMRAMIATHAAFWMVIPAAIGALSQNSAMMIGSGIGAAGLIGYALYQGFKS